MNVYACYNLNESIRERSSSGGVFYLLAESVIAHGGVVFGAEFDAEFAVRHGYTETLEGISKFMGSKYVQSSMGTSYLQVRDFLRQGRMVLFSGTPCQAAGLVAFLEGKPDNLLLVDLICHGVPSPKVWRGYLKNISRKNTISSVNFRSKVSGWETFSLEIDLRSKKGYRECMGKDAYMQGFLKNLTLRPSCYACQFKGTDRISDLTLGDFWDVKELLPEMYDNKGTSIVMIHSAVGEAIWNEIADRVCAKEITEEQAGKCNPCLFASVEENKSRAEFFAGIGRPMKTLKGMTGRTFSQRLRNKLKRLINIRSRAWRD